MLNINDINIVMLEKSEPTKIDKDHMEEIKELIEHKILKPYFLSERLHWDDKTSAVFGMGDLKGKDKADEIKVLMRMDKDRDVKEEISNFGYFLNKTPKDIVPLNDKDVKFEVKSKNVIFLFKIPEDEEQKVVLVKVIFSANDDETDFKDKFYNIDEDKRAFVTAWFKIAYSELSEHEKNKIIKKAGLEKIDLGDDEKFGFRLKHNEFMVIKRKFNKKGKEIKRKVLWRTKKWDELIKAFPFDIEKPVYNLAIDARKFIKDEKNKKIFFDEMKDVLFTEREKKDKKETKGLNAVKKQFGITEGVETDVINQPDENGITPLAACFIRSKDGEVDDYFEPIPNLKMLEFLLKNGADPRIEFSFTYDGVKDKTSLMDFVSNSITKYSDEAFFDKDLLKLYEKASKLLLKYGA
jgi:hypothetical protein